MRDNFKNILGKIGTPNLLAIYMVAAMMIPNILLNITEQMPVAAKVANILLPLGIWTLLTGMVKRPGRLILWLLFFLVLDAFEIVILYLFGESIVAIDMFVNVVTTTPAEATELLRNLALPLIFIFVVYLPLIVWAIIAAKHKVVTAPKYRKVARIAGVTAILAGVAALIIAIAGNPKFKASRSIFPYNVTSNFVSAIGRVNDSLNYHKTSADFTYHAVDTHAANDSLPEIHVFVVGETSRAANWELGGYSRPTNPLLSRRDDITYFDHSVSQSNTTHKCVPMLLSYLEAANFDSINHSKSIITAFNEAGYETSFFTTQPKNGSYNQFFGEEADNTAFLDARSGIDDHSLVDLLKEQIVNGGNKKQFIVLHTYGSHFKYRDRYPRIFAVNTPDEATDAERRNRTDLINAYDNSIIYTDFLLNEIMDAVSETGAIGSVLYTPDHGEDIFDDSRDRFLHASPSPTYYQIHVPMVIWTSEAYENAYPEKRKAMRSNSQKYCSAPENAFHTVCELAGISTPYFNAAKSLASETFESPTPLYLNDYNEAIPLAESGLKPMDFEKFESKGIQIRK